MESILLITKCLGLVEMMSGLVNATVALVCLNGKL